MAVQRSVMLPSAVVVIVCLSFMVAACGAQLPTGCPPVDDRNDTATILPNPFDCATFYLCSQGKPVLMECPRGLHFNDTLKVCDHANRVNCVPLEPTPAPEPIEVATSKVVVTKIVKEIFNPEDVNVDPVTIENEVHEDDPQPTTARPADVDADVSLDDALSTPVVAVDDWQPDVVNADAAVSDVNSAVEPVENTVVDTDSGLLDNVVDEDANLGVL